MLLSTRQILVFLSLFVTSHSALSNSFYNTTDGFELDPLISDKPFDISINAELGALITTGNDESTSILSKISVQHTIDEWQLNYAFASLFKKSNLLDYETNERFNKTTAEKYSLEGSAKYELDEKRSLFSFAKREFDRFGAYEDYFIIVGGYAFRAIDGSLITWDLDIAPGYTLVKPLNETTDSAPVVRASSNFYWTISSHAKVSNLLSVETSNINTRVTFDTALTAKIHGSMLMKVSYKATSDDSVAVGLSNTNTQTSVTLVVNF